MTDRHSLYTESVDDDGEAHDFDTFDAALAAARSWFLEGYESKGTVSKAELAEDVAQMEADLRRVGEYRCGRFHEHIVISPMRP